MFFRKLREELRESISCLKRVIFELRELVSELRMRSEFPNNNLIVKSSEMNSIFNGAKYGDLVTIQRGNEIVAKGMLIGFGIMATNFLREENALSGADIFVITKNLISKDESTHIVDKNQVKIYKVNAI